MSENEQVPFVPRRNRKRCPVCGEPSFSASGIHPECAKKPQSVKHPFQVWLRPLGDKFRIRVESQTSARWLIAHLEALPGSNECEDIRHGPRGYSFNFPLSSDINRLALLKILRELSEIEVMPQLA